MRSLAAMMVGMGSAMMGPHTTPGMIGSLLLTIGIVIYANTSRKP